MKNSKFRLSIIIVAIIITSITTLQSCNKDDISSDLPTSNQTAQKSYTTSIKYNTKNKLLVFKDTTEVRTTIQMLDDSVSDRYNKFIQANNSLSESDLLKLMDQVDFNEFDALTNFESNFSGYVSLRSNINSEMQSYYGQSTFDWGNTPDSHFIQDEYTRSILNKDNALQIGDTTYVMVDSGYYSFKDASSYQNVINAISTGNNPSTLYPNINWFTWGVKDLCKASKMNIYSSQVGSDKMISILGISQVWFLGAHIYAETKSYHKFFGVWWPKRSRVYVGLYDGITVYDGNCNNPASVPFIDPETRYGFHVQIGRLFLGQLVKLRSHNLHSSNSAFSGNIVADYYLLW